MSPFFNCHQWTMLLRLLVGHLPQTDLVRSIYYEKFIIVPQATCTEIWFRLPWKVSKFASEIFTMVLNFHISSEGNISETVSWRFFCIFCCFQSREDHRMTLILIHDSYAKWNYKKTVLVFDGYKRHSSLNASSTRAELEQLCKARPQTR